MVRSDGHSLKPFVERLQMRSTLSPEEEQALLALPVHAIGVRARRDFAHISEQRAYSCFVAHGLVGRFAQNREGLRQTTALHIPGDMADLDSAVLPSATEGLSALSDSIILRVPHVALRSLAARYPAVAEAFWRDSAIDKAILAQGVFRIGRHDTRTRLAHLLCEMAVRYGAGGKPSRDYRFPITQEQLADVLAVTSVHMSRCLKALRNERLVKFERRSVVIMAWSQLARAGEFNAAYLWADGGHHMQHHVFEAV